MLKKVIDLLKIVVNKYELNIEITSIYDNFETAKLWKEIMEGKDEDSDRSTRRI